MKYYRVKKQCDQMRKVKFNKKGEKYANGEILVANELYTPAEYKRLGNNPNCFTEVEINRNRTYVLFGSRFEEGVTYRD